MTYRRIIATACGLLLSAHSAHAQRPLSLTVAGGVSVPVGNYADVVQTGWHAAGGILVSAPWHPIGLRADVTHHRFEFDAGAAGHERITSGTLSVLYRLPSAGWPVAPYVTAGAGAYHIECGGDANCASTTRFGWSAG